MRYIWGEKLLYSHFHTICQGGGGGGHFWGKIYYIVIFPPIQVRGENGFGGGMTMGENGSITPCARRVLEITRER